MSDALASSIRLARTWSDAAGKAMGAGAEVLAPIRPTKRPREARILAAGYVVGALSLLREAIKELELVREKLEPTPNDLDD